jgi:hypothetical protein
MGYISLENEGTTGNYIRKISWFAGGNIVG